MTVRREMGRDIGGACGQLRKSYLEKGRGGRAMNAYGTDRHRTECGRSNQDSYFALPKRRWDRFPTFLWSPTAWAGIRPGDFASRFVVDTMVR